MIRVVIEADAKDDVRQATRYYADREHGLGQRFLDEVRDAISKIREMPLQFPVIDKNVRRALLNRFPYVIYFMLFDKRKASIIAVLHQKRHPSAFDGRVGRGPKRGG
ncbi:MAG: type II toxin-antitoxin system RelE/ParE family toxin [Polyangiaceae bacterium]|nr:type II toxin-antitoxin system RelE/ParE family toxin [Polyangiaceae bacterium]